MKRKSSILTKLAEESSETAQAACKHMLHGDSTTRGNLEQEVGDFLAFVGFAVKRGIINMDNVVKHQNNRVKREQIKGKA